MKRFNLILLSLFFISKIYGQYPPNSVWVPQLPDPVIDQPGYLETVLDEVDNILITRISDPDVFGYPPGSAQVRAPYAKKQAWNADMSKIMLGFTMLLNADDYTVDVDIESWYPQGYFNEGRWSNVDPDIRYFCYHEMFLKVNIATQDIDTLVTLPNYNTMTVGPWEGNISADDRYVVLTDAAANQAALYDILNNTILSTYYLGGAGFDWVSITPSGDYIAVSNNVTGHVELYDHDFNFIRIISTTQPHGDFAVDTDGNEVFVQVISLSMTRLSDGFTTDLISSALVCGNYSFDPNISGHISGRNFDMPGWAFVSTPLTNECTNGLGYYAATEIFAIKLDGSGTIKRYGHAYNSESTATASPDGTKLMFTSDWDMENYLPNQMLAYVAEYNVGTELEAKILLEGPYNSETQLMNDGLRQNNQLPLEEPFTVLGFNHVNGGGEVTTQAVLDVEGNDAIVDWIFVELRDAAFPNDVLVTQSALLQADGDVVGMDGFSHLSFQDINVGEVVVVIRHRNHLGVRALESFPANQKITIDFTNPNTDLFGIQPMVNIDGKRAMFAGDANNDGQVNPVDKNDYWRVENGNPYNYINSKADFNMDGVVNPVDKNGYWRINNSKIEQLD